MILGPEHLVELCGVAVAAARKAGAFIASQAQKPVTVFYKPGADSLAAQVVTAVDQGAQELILQDLLPTCERFGLALLTEESADDRKRLEMDNFWCVDPLDGTLSFVEGHAGYAVSIGLVSRAGVPLLGVVFDPVTGTLFHGLRGLGAWRNGEPWVLPADRARACDAWLTFYTDRSFLQHPLYAQAYAGLDRVARELGFLGVRMGEAGGGVLNACRVLMESPACYFKYPKSEAGGGSLWDYAATACLFAEMNGQVSDMYGNALDLNRADSTFMNPGGVLYASSAEIAQCIRDDFYRIVKS